MLTPPSARHHRTVIGLVLVCLSAASSSSHAIEDRVYQSSATGAIVANDILLGERFGGAGAGVQFEIRLPKVEIKGEWFITRGN